MSTYNVLRETSKALRDVLWKTIETTPDVHAFVPSMEDIVFTNPTQTARDHSKRLSLWLYQVTENEFLKNKPPERANGHDTLAETPLALNLYYLATPFTDSPEHDLQLLGLVMRALYENTTIPVRSADEVFEDLRVILCRLSLEELTRIWEALREPYRLSVSYQVRVTRINTSRVLQRARVVESDHNYGDLALIPGR